MDDILFKISYALEIVSFAIMIYGSMWAILGFLKTEITRFKGKFAYPVLNVVRQHFGTYILLGLEFLIAADIIQTILKPTVEELIELGGIVLIRILLSYFLAKEIESLKKGEVK